MGSLDNLRPIPFTSENQPANRGRKKGVPNRSTVYKRILETKIDVKMPNGKIKNMTVYEAAALGQVQSAMKGNTNAWKEIQDSLHGKLIDKTELSNPEGESFRTEISGKIDLAINKIYGDSSGASENGSSG